MANDANRFLDDIIESLADIESALNVYDYREAEIKAPELHHKAEELLSAIQREGLAVLQAEQVADEVPAQLDPAIDGALFGGSSDHSSIVAVWAHYERRAQAIHQAAVLGAQQSANAALLS